MVLLLCHLPISCSQSSLWKHEHSIRCASRKDDLKTGTKNISDDISGGGSGGSVAKETEEIKDALQRRSVWKVYFIA